MEENKKHPSHMTAEEIKEDIKQVIERKRMEEEAKKDINEKVEKKKQTISVSYTLKAINHNIEKLNETKVINRDEYEIMKKIHKKAVQKYIERHFM